MWLPVRCHPQVRPDSHETERSRESTITLWPLKSSSRWRSRGRCWRAESSKVSPHSWIIYEEYKVLKGKYIISLFQMFFLRSCIISLGLFCPVLMYWFTVLRAPFTHINMHQHNCCVGNTYISNCSKFKAIAHPKIIIHPVSHTKLIWLLKTENSTQVVWTPFIIILYP